MSISTLSGVIYVNQAMPAVTQVHNEHLAKQGFQAEMAREMISQQEKEVEDIRPMEETGKTEPDKHGSSNTPEGELHREKKEPKEEKHEEVAGEPHLLDILA